MSSAVSIDSKGNLVIPLAVLQDSFWQSGVDLEAENTPDGILVKPVTPVKELTIGRNAKGRLVIQNAPPLTEKQIIQAIAADRK